MKLQGKSIIVLVLAFAFLVLILIEWDRLRFPSATDAEQKILTAKVSTETGSPTPLAKSGKGGKKGSGQFPDDDELASGGAGKATSKTKRSERATTGTVRLRRDDGASSGAISGMILKSSGEGIENARVELFRLADTSAAAAFQSSAKTGAFRFAGLAADLYEIVVSHADYASECVSNIALRESQRIDGVKIILRGGAALKGIVVDTGDKPIEGARIRAMKKVIRIDPAGGETLSGTFKCGEILSDKTGSFAFQHLPEGENQLIAQKDGYAVETVPVTLTVGPAVHEVKIVLKPAGVIGGQVLSPLRKPIAKAKISATAYFAKDGKQSKPENIPPATSNDSGQFTLKNLLSEGAYDVTVEAENFARGFFHRISVNTLNNTFILQNGGTISGSVKRLETKEPVKRVRLLLTSDDEKFPYTAETLTNEKGLYAFLGITPGTYTVAVNSPRLTAPAQKGIKVENNKDVTGIDFLVYQGITVQGKVVEAATGNAVAEAEVKARALAGAQGGAPAESTARSNTNGTFEMKNLRAGIYYFTATAEGYLKIDDVAKQEKVELAVNKPPPFVKIKVYRGGEVKGVVLDETGSAVPFAAVQLFQAPQTRKRIDTRTLQTTTDLTGAFAINGIWIATPVELYASAYREGFANGKSDRIVLTEYSPTASIIITLKKGALLTGVVTDSNRIPIPGAVVSATPTQFENDPLLSAYTASTSELGTYQILNLPPGEVRVRASAAGYAPYERNITLLPDERTRTLNIVLTTGMTISGYVMDDVGHAIENAEVRITNPPHTGRTVLSDAMGYYQIDDLENRRHDMMARCSRNTAAGKHSYYTIRRNIPAGRENVSFVFPINGSLKGRVVDDRNSVPVNRFMISLTATVDTGDGTTGRFSIARASFSESAGEFTLTDLPTGTYQLTFSADGYAKLELGDIQIVSPSSRNVGDIGLNDGGKLQARIISVRTGDPVGDVRGTLTPAPGGQGTSNLDGILVIDNLAEGTYQLTLTHQHYVPQTVPGVIIQEDRTTDLHDIAMTPGGIAAGLVSDNDGKPLSGIRITAEVLNDGRELSANSDAGGYYLIDGIPDGPAKIRAEGSVYGHSCSRSKIADIRADEQSQVDFILDPSCAIVGRIYSSQFAFSNLAVIAYQIDELNSVDPKTRTNGTINADGTFRVSNIVAGEYYVIAEGKVTNPPPGIPSRTIRAFERVSVYSTETVKDVEFSNGRVEGIIVGRRDGKPVQRAGVKLVYGGGVEVPGQIADRYFTFTGSADTEGFFSLYGLMPGHYEAFASRPSANWERCESVYLSHRAAVAELTCSID